MKKKKKKVGGVGGRIDASTRCSAASASVSELATSAATFRREIGMLLPKNQRQHRTLHIQQDVLPYALC